MLSILKSLVFVALMIGLNPGAWAATPRDEPPPPDVSDLAEQLAPLLKNNPQLPALPAKKDEEPLKNTEIVTEVEAETPPSPVEEAFSQRAGQKLRLFGYNQIGRQISEAPTNGEIQDSIVLGSGDKVMITFRGQRDDSKTYTITPQGELIIDGLNPVTAAGLTIGTLRTLLEQEAAKNLLNSTVFVSVKSLRQIAVTVMGEVQSPGVYTLSPFQTVLDALSMAKGITTNGSLRQVRLLRDGKAINLDFYKLLLQGDLGAPIQLRSGDKIMVPVLGQTIAVTGEVKRPGIFELAGNEKNDFGDVLHLAGGVIRPGANQFVKLSLTSFGDENVSDIFPGSTIVFRDGDMLMVTGGVPLRTNGIQVLGAVRQSGPRPVSKVPDLKTLLNNPRFFEDDIYPLMAVIERFDTKTLSPLLLEFSPARVMQGLDNVVLDERDRVLFFSKGDIKRVLKEKPVQKNGREKAEEVFAGDPAFRPKDDDDNTLLSKEIVAFLSDRAAIVQGAVLEEGRYPIAGKVALNDVLTVAGGLRPDADRRNVDILLANAQRNGRRYTVDLDKDRPNAILIAAKDKVTINDTYTTAEKGGVKLMGEVRRPGVYDLRKGDTIRDVIERAGGLTEIAYVPGTIFMRESERRKQLAQYRNTARELDLAVAGYYMKRDGAKENAEQIRTAQTIADDLRHSDAVGRITVEADPEILRRHPEQAMLLQPNDKIYIPRLANTVAVAGEVLSPAVLQYDPDMSGPDYIKAAGGTTQFADKGRAFIVFPDGSASPLNSRPDWRGQRGIPLGSTIIVPRDPDPLDFLKVTSSIGNILSQMAITTLIVSEISNR